jgi:hypothetical protein
MSPSRNNNRRMADSLMAVCGYRVVCSGGGHNSLPGICRPRAREGLHGLALAPGHGGNDPGQPTGVTS